MKVERKEVKFEPITITLESQEEVDQMYAIASTISFSCERDITSDLFEQLINVPLDAVYELEGDVFHLYKE